MGKRDMERYKRQVAKLKTDLLKIGVRIVGNVNGDRMKSNWHFSCTASVGTVCESDLSVRGVRGLYVGDVSAMRVITPMNIMIMSYFIAFSLARRMPD